MIGKFPEQIDKLQDEIKQLKQDNQMYAMRFVDIHDNAKLQEENSQLRKEIEQLNKDKQQLQYGKYGTFYYCAISEKWQSEVEQFKAKLRQCEIISNNVLYFDDSSDYSTALWQILNVTQDRKADDDCYDIKLKYMEEDK